MRKKLLLLPILAIVLVCCRDNSKMPLSLSDNKMSITFEGGELPLEIHVDANDEWDAFCNVNWVKLSTSHGHGSHRILLGVDPNIEGARPATITVSSGSAIKTVTINQSGKPDNFDLTYTIPVIFHVLYNDESNPKQNIPYEHITRVLNVTNELYAHAGDGSPNLGIKFVLADKDPLGRILPEPGVVRVRWPQASMSATEFMSKPKPENIALMWDPNKYVNIMLYNFEVPNLLGISTFPLVPENHPMLYLETVPTANLSTSDLKRVRGVSINSIYMDEVDTEDKPNRLDVGPTLAHELGHYFGLRHVFSEASNPLVTCQDTDGCMDTPSYDKEEYTQEVNVIFSRLRSDADYSKDFDASILYYRNSCYKEGRFLSRNLMDYDFCLKNQFTEDQKRIVRHVLTYSPFIPGPKIKDTTARAFESESMELPYTLSNCPEPLVKKYPGLVKYIDK